MTENVEKSLAESEKAFSASLMPDALAKRMAPKLMEVASEIARRGASATNPDEKELLELDAAVVELSVEALRRCEQEQWRQREAIKLFLHGRITQSDLRKISESWNGDRALEPAA